MKKAIKIILVNILIAIALFIILELSLRLSLYLIKGKDNYEISKYIISEVCGVYINGWGNNLGFNTTYDNTVSKDKNRVKILVVGGSGAGGKTEENWPAILMELLNKDASDKSYEVYNGGVGGATSSRELYLLSRWIYLKPDVVIIYDGWNDVYFSHYSKTPYFSYDRHAHKRVHKKSKRLRFFLKRHLEIARQLTVLRGNIREARDRKTQCENKGLTAAKQITKPNTDVNITALNPEHATLLRINYEGNEVEYLITDASIEDNVSGIYEDNLKEMIDVCHKNNIRCIVITQPSLLYYKHKYNPQVNVSALLNLDFPKYKDWRRTVRFLYPMIIETARRVCQREDCLYFDFNNIYGDMQNASTVCTDDAHQNLKGKA